MLHISTNYNEKHTLIARLYKSKYNKVSSLIKEIWIFLCNEEGKWLAIHHDMREGNKYKELEKLIEQVPEYNISLEQEHSSGIFLVSSRHAEMSILLYKVK